MQVWKYLRNPEKMKILEIISHEKIVQMNSMFLTPESDVFFEKSKFYSDLKQKAVSRP